MKTKTISNQTYYYYEGMGWMSQSGHDRIQWERANPHLVGSNKETPLKP